MLEHLSDWRALTERIAYWVDLDDAYYTFEPSYIESVWWALKTMWDRDLLYEGHKVVPYCARCGTALSSHEVAQGYKDVEDPSIYVRFPVTRPAGALREGDDLLAWTTTPWTLASNAALAVDPELTYVRTTGGEVLAEALAERVLGAASRSPTASRAASCSARATSRRSRSSPRRSSARRATPCCRPTSSAPTTAPASSTRRSRSARTTSGSAPSRAST